MPDKEQTTRLSIGLETASSNRNLAAGLVGTCLAILTFLLFFLYDRASRGEIDVILFQTAIIIIIIAISSFTFSGLYYYELMISLSSGGQMVKSDLLRAEAFVILGILLLALEPTIVLFTLRLVVVGLLALGLWLVQAYYVLLKARRRPYEVVVTPRN